MGGEADQEFQIGKHLEQRRSCPWGSEPHAGALEPGWQARVSQSSESKRNDKEKNVNVFLFALFPEDPSLLGGGGSESLQEAGLALGP